MSDYAEILATMKMKAEETLSAYNRNDYAAGHRYLEEIALLYFPENDNTTARVENLLTTVISTMYFGGVEYGTRDLYNRQQTAHERSFTPPF